MSTRQPIQVGARFQRLTTLGSEIKRDKKNRKTRKHWLCVCDCGEQVTVRDDHLKSGAIISCGCLHSEITAARSTRHGHANRGKLTDEYNIWSNLLARCLNQDNERFSSYGERGITVCDRWLDFSNFLADMGLRPSSAHSIDRKNNDGNYCPDNCRWATRKEQARNKRNNRMLTLNGKTQCMAAWVEELGLTYSATKARIRRGWSVERALTETAAGR